MISSFGLELWEMKRLARPPLYQNSTISWITTPFCSVPRKIKPASAARH